MRFVGWHNWRHALVEEDDERKYGGNAKNNEKPMSKKQRFL